MQEKNLRKDEFWDESARRHETCEEPDHNQNPDLLPLWQTDKEREEKQVVCPTGEVLRTEKSGLLSLV